MCVCGDMNNAGDACRSVRARRRADGRLLIGQNPGNRVLQRAVFRPDLTCTHTLSFFFSLFPKTTHTGSYFKVKAEMRL